MLAQMLPTDINHDAFTNRSYFFFLLKHNKHLQYEKKKKKEEHDHKEHSKI